MARHKNHQPGESESPALDISSLIDVCFLLLIYFIATSTLAPRETDLDLKLPVPGVILAQTPIPPMFIKIDSADTIHVGTDASEQILDTDSTVRELPLLSAQLDIYASAARSANNKPLVQIWADNGATQQRVVDVLNALAGKGIHSVTFTDLVD